MKMEIMPVLVMSLLCCVIKKKKIMSIVCACLCLNSIKENGQLCVFHEFLTNH